MRRQPSRPPIDLGAFAGFRFPPEVIVLAVCWYLRFGLSCRDLEELLVERGVEVDHVTLFGGCNGSHRVSVDRKPSRSPRLDLRTKPELTPT